MRSKSVRSPGTTMARRPVASTSFATSRKLLLGASGQHDVGAGFGQGNRGAGADTAPAGGDDGDLVRHEELVEDHPGECSGRTGGRPWPGPVLGAGSSGGWISVPVFLVGHFGIFEVVDKLVPRSLVLEEGEGRWA